MKNSIKSNYISSQSPFAVSRFSKLISDYILDEKLMNKEIVILCIGTDRSTGDCLGPLVGHKLYPMLKSLKRVHLIGTLDNPIHALNLETNINRIYEDYKNPFVIAIDSSLGSQSKIGYLSIKNSPLKPGSGVNKTLPEIGDISITGIVNLGGMMEFMVLQNTRLSLVMNMAEIISKSLYLSLLRVYRENELDLINEDLSKIL